MRFGLWIAGAALLVGCADDDVSRPVEICVASYDRALYRDGEGPWLPAEADARGAHTLDVVDDFEFLGVDDTDQGYTYVTLWRSTVREWNAQRTVADSSTLDCASANPSGVEVTGMLAQDGIISLDGVSRRVAAGPFSFYVEPGTYDLVASSATSVGGGRTIIQRDVSISGATTLPPIDAAQGVELMSIPIEVSNASQQPYARTYLLVDGGVSFAEISGRSDRMVDVLPASALESDDEQWVYVFAPSSGAEIRYTGSVPPIDLLPPLDGVTYENQGAQGLQPSTNWSALPADYDYISLTLQGQTSVDKLAYQYLYASRGWNEARGATSLGLDSEIPGFESRWLVNPFTLTEFLATVYMPPKDNVTLWAQPPSLLIRSGPGARRVVRTTRGVVVAAE